jgi:ribosomal peptide maturation radical SAM protein 1
VLFGDQIPDADAYVSKVLSRYPSLAALVPDILRARASCAGFVECCAQAIYGDGSRVVGFTTTFHQTCASLAVARALKQTDASRIVVFGGANCEGEMGLQMIRSFPWLDYVCTQEGDLVFPELLQRLLREGQAGAVPGFLKAGESTALTDAPLVSDMDALPVPNFHDYFAALESSPVAGAVERRVPVETSRGCWWGEKHQCTFCGLNGASMQFRSKSADRVLDELAHLSRTYDVTYIDCVDNILDLNYLRTLFPRISEVGRKVELFYETKANLKYQQLVTLHEAGVRSIQPGLESLSNAVLRIMRKGCTGLQNIALLRWCAELGIDVAWNIIFGFPGEPPAEYHGMARLLPLLVHLQPPASCAPFRLDRFSPYFEEAEAFGLRRVRPASAAYYVFPFGRRVLEKLVYYFEYDRPDDPDPVEYTDALLAELAQWWTAYASPPEARPRLDLTRWGDQTMLLVDTRPCAVAREHCLEQVASQVYRLCDTPQSVSSLTRRVGGQVTESQVRQELESLLNAKLMVEMEGQHLSLAVFRDRPPVSLSGEDTPDASLQLQQAAPALLRSGPC